MVALADRQTDEQGDRGEDAHTDIQKRRQTASRKADRQKHRQIDRKTHIQIYIQKRKHTTSKKGRQADAQTDTTKKCCSE
jgi:hypothetical protein